MPPQRQRSRPEQLRARMGAAAAWIALGALAPCALAIVFSLVWENPPTGWPKWTHPLMDSRGEMLYSIAAVFGIFSVLLPRDLALRRIIIICVAFSVFAAAGVSLATTRVTGIALMMLSIPLLILLFANSCAALYNAVISKDAAKNGDMSDDAP